MSDSVTSNFSWIKPAVGASAETWGSKWNQNLDEIDSQVVLYLPLAGGTVTGDLWAQDFYTNGDISANGAVTATGGFSTPGNITAGGGVVIDSTLGVNYAGIGAYWFAFGWNGAINCYVDGNYEGDIATTGWVNGNFKPIGAYTPNQNVDYNQSPTFFNLTCGGTFYATNGGANHQFSNGTFAGTLTVNNTLSVGNGGAIAGAGLRYSNYDAANYLAFQWDGQSVFSWVNGGAQGWLVRSPSSGAPFPIYQLYVDGSHSLILNVAGGGYFYHATTAGSDRRLKDNVSPASADALGIVNRVGVYDVDLRNTGDPNAIEHWQCSLMADEVGAHIPNAWIHGQEGRFDGLRDLPLIATLWRAVQQLSAEVAQLKGA